MIKIKRIVGKISNSRETGMVKNRFSKSISETNTAIIREFLEGLDLKQNKKNSLGKKIGKRFIVIHLILMLEQRLLQKF